jgi:serine/threonine-protein kinase
MATRPESTADQALSAPADSELVEDLIRSGLASKSEIRRCRAVQERHASQNTPKSLIEVLVEKGFVTATQAHRLGQGQTTATDIPGYQILEKLGHGSMGVVYKARQKSINRVVAVKVLRPQLATSKDFITRFRREAELAGQLSSNHVVQAIDAGSAGGHHYFVMEYVEGVTVKDEMEHGKTYGEQEALEIVLQVAEGLRHAHNRGMIHRDIKPDNIIRTADGTVKLADLGLARPTEDGQWAEAEEGLAIGTPYYISPEQIRGKKDIDAGADIYSLGATLYHMVTGRVPFTGKTPTDVMFAHLKTELVPPDHVNTELSGGLGEVVETMMAKNRENRYASCEDLILDLKSLVAGDPPLLARERVRGSALADLAEGESERRDDELAEEIEEAWETVDSVRRQTTILGLLLGLSVIANLVLLFLVLASRL